MNAAARILLANALCLAALIVPARRASADSFTIQGDTYAAIAYSPATGKYACSYSYGSRWSAEKAALKQLNQTDGEIVTWVNNGFCALAIGDDLGAYGTGWSWGDGASNSEAKQRALSQAAKRTSGGRIVICVCSMDVIEPEIR